MIEYNNIVIPNIEITKKSKIFISLEILNIQSKLNHE